MSRTTRRLLIVLCLASVALSVPRAAKLVFLRNGRVLHAEEVRLDEGWYTLTLARRSTIAIPAALIDDVKVIEAPAAAETLANVQTSAGGRGGAVPAGRPARPNAAPAVRTLPGRRAEGAARSTARTPPQARARPPQLTEDARLRAAALAARGRNLGQDLESRRNGSGRAGSPEPNTQIPAGVDLNDSGKSWPSLLGGRRRQQAGGDSGQEPPDDDNH